MAKATGREAPAQGSDPGCSTLNFRGLPWGISFKKKKEVRDRLLTAQAHMKQYYDQGHRDMKLEVGDWA